jgi:hypothetical protein
MLILYASSASDKKVDIRSRSERILLAVNSTSSKYSSSATVIGRLSGIISVQASSTSFAAALNFSSLVMLNQRNLTVEAVEIEGLFEMEQVGFDEVFFST